MAVVFRPHSYKVRVFAEDQQYGDPYTGVMLITWQGPDVVEIDMAHGELSRRDMLDICYELAELGVTTVRAWRADSHRLPGSRAVRTDGRFTLWEGELAHAIPHLERICRV